MPREENEAEEIKGLVGGLVLLGLVCTFMFAMSHAGSRVTEDNASRSSVAQNGKRSD